MRTFAERVADLRVEGPLLVSDRSSPLGAAWLPDVAVGVDLAACGYGEWEYLLRGFAEVWTWDAGFRAQCIGERPFTTRVLVRRPLDPTRFSGSVQLEPHHPDDDRALTWAMIAPWILRGGHAHVGVTQEPATVPDLRRFDPDRYERLQIVHSGQRWDILGLVAGAIRVGALPAFEDLSVSCTVMSGWSMTGTFCRTFLGEGFHERCWYQGSPVIDGYVICISSGGAGRAGYARLGDAILPPDDARRTIGAHSVPIVELLSEGEAETHHSVLRADADGPQDRYRLYEVAGTGHVITGTPSLTTNRLQMERRGFPPLLREINEKPSDARMDLVARAVFESMERWLRDGAVPPRAGRFAYADPTTDAPRGLMDGSLPLARDADGNVLGGVRTPWIEVPAAAYLPHSTPRPGRCKPAPHAPYSDPVLLADLIAHMRPFDPPTLRRRYGSPARYLQRFEQSALQLCAAGWLLEADLPELLDSRRTACARF